MSDSGNFLVVPGQILTVSHKQDEASSFLRGHGTYMESVVDDDDGGGGGGGDNETPNAASAASSTRLVASTVGIVQRVNKLVSVASLSERGGITSGGQVGDLVVGRITAVTSSRWTVQLAASGGGNEASLPLSGVYLPGGAQRMRTAQDARAMRCFLKEGDLVAAEIHKVPSSSSSGSATAGAGAAGGTLLHTRSSRYGKLENGCLVAVPPFLVPRRKQHVTTVNLPANNDADSQTVSPIMIIFGCNGSIWMQRDLAMFAQDATSTTTTTATATGTVTGGGGGPELVELHQQQQAQHAETPYSRTDRRAMARLSNCLQILVTAKQACTVENLQLLYKESLSYSEPAQLLRPNVVVELAARLQQQQQQQGNKD